MIQNSLRTPLKLRTPAFLACAAFSLLPLLPSRAPVPSLSAGFRLLSSSAVLVSVGPVCPPRFSWSWLVLVAPSSLWVCFVLLAWPVFWFVLFVWCFFVLSVSGWFLGFAFCFCWFPPRHSEQVHSFMLLPPVQLRSWFVIVLVSVRRLDRFTCTVYLHRVTMFLLKCSCVTIC